MTAPLDQARLRDSEERIRRWAFYEYNGEDAVAVKSPLSTFTAGDLRMVLDALSAERERGDRAVGLLERVKTACVGPEVGAGDGGTHVVVPPPPDVLRDLRAFLTPQSSGGENA